jgi:hypothetical protein
MHIRVWYLLLGYVGVSFASIIEVTGITRDGPFIQSMEMVRDIPVTGFGQQDR